MKAFLTLFLLFFGFSFQAEADAFQAESFMLENGMQVVVIENHRAPIVTHMVWYKTGAIDDALGKAGTAHLLEHLMFKGTPKIPDGEFSKIIARNGGQENAFTSLDFTAYYQNIARDRLELVMFLEADRMKNLLFSEQDFLPELEVVKEERLMRVENTPSALLKERKNEVFWNIHPYARPVIGSKKEIASLTLQDVKAFYQKNYVPEKAILVVAGAVTSQEVKELAEKYYAPLPPSRAPVIKRQMELAYPVTSVVKMNHPQVKINSLAQSYLVPSYVSEGKEDAFAYAVLAEVLGAYHSGRLYRHFVSRKKNVRSIGASYNAFSLDKGTFSISLVAQDGEKLEDLEEELDAFLNQKAFSAKDVENAQKRLVSGMEYLNDNPERIANLMGMFYVLGLRAEDLKNWKQNILNVKVKDVEKVYTDLLNSQKVTSYLMPEEV